MFRAIYRKGRASHSDELRDARKVLFYAGAEVKRLEKLAESRSVGGPIPADATYLVGEQFDDFGKPFPLEPAADMEDDSERMQAIGQNGNTGEHYEGSPSWDKAPEWANWLAQDANGRWFWFKLEPLINEEFEEWLSPSDNELAEYGAPCENWRATLIQRPAKES